MDEYNSDEKSSMAKFLLRFLSLVSNNRFPRLFKMVNTVGNGMKGLLTKNLSRELPTVQ